MQAKRLQGGFSVRAGFSHRETVSLPFGPKSRFFVGVMNKKLREKAKAIVRETLERLGGPRGDWDGEHGTEFSIFDVIRIRVDACQNATQVQRVFEVRRIAGLTLFARDVQSRNLFKIEIRGLLFEVVP